MNKTLALLAAAGFVFAAPAFANSEKAAASTEIKAEHAKGEHKKAHKEHAKGEHKGEHKGEAKGNTPVNADANNKDKKPEATEAAPAAGSAKQ